jgi:hypothetical protein
MKLYMHRNGLKRRLRTRGKEIKRENRDILRMQELVHLHGWA